MTMAANVSIIRFTLVWTRFVDEALRDPFGPLTFGAEYQDAHATGSLDGVTARRPWSHGNLTWSRFWSSYLTKPERLRYLDPAVAWDYLVPLTVAASTYTTTDATAE